MAWPAQYILKINFKYIYLGHDKWQLKCQQPRIKLVYVNVYPFLHANFACVIEYISIATNL